MSRNSGNIYAPEPLLTVSLRVESPLVIEDRSVDVVSPAHALCDSGTRSTQLL